MSNYNTLKSAIQAAIKTNGNNEITGQILQDKLLSMIATLGFGYQFMGIAFPNAYPGTPDAKIFYIAYQAGTYTYMGGIVVTGLCVLKYDTTWTKEDIPISGGGGGADFTVEATDLNLSSGDPKLLKFADRIQGANMTSGRNYIIVRENLDFATQVVASNAIYEIRYDFDLDGETVQIPNNCVLKFTGGKLSNGVLDGDFAVEADLVKIFDGISFTGNCINNIYQLDWFVGQKNMFLDLTVNKKNSTVEVQAAFNSGVMNIHVSNRYFYYLSAKVTIKSWVSLVGDRISIAHYRVGEQGEPCFYTDQAITMIEIIGDSDNNNKIQREIIFDQIHLRHYGPIAYNDYHINTPILYIHNGTGVNPQVWGVRINAQIYFSDKKLTELDRFTVGYTGIEIYAENGGYFTYIDIKGNINNLRRGVYIHSAGGGSWVTDVRLGFDSICIWGGEISAAPVRITGSHQTLIKLTAEELAGNPYFFKVPYGVFTGMVWDMGATDEANVTLYNVTRAFYASSAAMFDLITRTPLVVPDSVNVPPGNIVNRWEKETAWKTIMLNSNFLEKVFHGVKGWQLQDNIASGLSGGIASNVRGQLESIRAYNASNEYIDLTEDDITNYSKLFNIGGPVLVGSARSYSQSDISTLKQSIITAGYTKFECCFTFDETGNFRDIEEFAYLCVVLGYAQTDGLNNVYMDIEFCDASNNVLDTKRYMFNETSENYFTRLYLKHFNFVNSTTAYSYIRLRLRDFRVHTQYMGIAKFGIISAIAGDNIISASGGEIGGPLVLRNAKFDLITANNGCRYEHNQYINKRTRITTGAYTKILNVCPYYNPDVYVVIVNERGGIAVVTMNKTSIKCTDKSINCKLEIHTHNTQGRLLLSIQSTGDAQYLYVSSVFCQNSVKFIDVGETHESGYFDTTVYASAIPKSGTTSQRPAIADVETGYIYFDTTLGKSIVSNGTAWVNMDGTALS